MPLTWEEVLKDRNFTSGDIEMTNVTKTVYRGPIAEMKSDFGSQIVITFPWIARKDGSGWVKDDKPKCIIQGDRNPPVTDKDGSVTFKSFSGEGKIIPKSKGKLDPKIVRGLSLDPLPALAGKR